MYIENFKVQINIHIFILEKCDCELLSINCGWGGMYFENGDGGY